MGFPELPGLDAHAHIAADVTADQIRRLGRVVVFAMTRSLSEAEEASRSAHKGLVWGIGTHPANHRALDEWSTARFAGLGSNFALVGEVGIDGRARDRERQLAVFTEILESVNGRRVLVSIHSTFVSALVTELLERHRPRAPVLHWFGGTPDEIRRATAAGAWFSVNAAMRPQVIAAMPPDRVLTETDFPFTRRAGSDKPGAVRPIEEALASVWGTNVNSVRVRVWSNLAELVERAGVAERLPGYLLEHLESARSWPRSDELFRLG